MATNRSIDREVFGVIFLLMLVFSNSEKIVGGMFQAIGASESSLWRVGVLVADVAILGVTALLKRAIGRADGRPGRLWGWWWGASLLVCVLDVGWLVLGDDAALAVSLVLSAAFVIATAILLTSALNADPRTLFSARTRQALPTDWIRVRATAPLIVGSVAVFCGATLWTDFFDPSAVRSLDPATTREIAQMPLVDQQVVLSEICDEGINPAYFQHIADVLPVLLLALGVEFNYFRRSKREPVQRAVNVITVMLMCAGLVLALSTLPFDGLTCGDVLAAWHEYLAFTITLQAVLMALATLVWMLLVHTSTAVPVGDDGADGPT